MLKGLDPLLSPELLYLLAAMGHGDELAVVDANFPATSTSRRLVRLPGADLSRAVGAILTVLPLDGPPAEPVAVMVDPSGSAAPVTEAAVAVAGEAVGCPLVATPLVPTEFYERARAAFAVVATAEGRAYGCVVLRKGVILVDEGGLDA